MNQVDLNIDNYNLNELLNLFKISIDFDERELKRIKLMVLKTHPDKCNLPKEYFLFYSQAYNLLYNIYVFKNKQKKEESYEYKNKDFVEKNENNKILLEEYLKINQLNNPQSFNQWFNQKFEEMNSTKKDGYGDWFKSEEDIVCTDNIPKTEMNAFIEQQKKKSQAIMKIDRIEEFSFSSSSYYDLNDYDSKSFSGQNSSLRYNDLKNAHTETLIPVTEDDIKNAKKYKNMEELNQFRNQEEKSFLILNEKQSKEYLKNFEKKNEEKCVMTAFHYAKETEDFLKKEEKFWSSIKNLK